MRRSVAGVLAIGVLVLILLVPGVSAATVLRASTANVGSSTRANGAATIYLYQAGAGGLGLRLTGLAPSTAYSVALYRGTCAALGTRFLALPLVVSSTVGTVRRGFTFSASRMALVRAALRGHLSVTVGSTRRCGAFGPLAVPTVAPSPSSTPSPSPSPSASPTEVPEPTATPVPMPPYMPPPMPTPVPMPTPTP